MHVPPLDEVPTRCICNCYIPLPHTTQEHARAGQRSRQLPRLCLAEWACPSISMHTRALAHGGALGLLSEQELAGLLGVDDVDLVMDGIAWR